MDTPQRRRTGPRLRGILWLAAPLALWLALAGATSAAAPSGAIPARPAAPRAARPSSRPPAPAGARTWRVAQDTSTIQAVVDAAHPGDLVLINRGVYHEAVKVTTPDLTIRGVDRNAVVLDGQFTLGNGFTIQANNVVVENMTVRNYIGNGFFWTGGRIGAPLSGYRGSYLTAYDNGDYGIYAYNAVQGQFDHSYASGSPDSGFYIGQCNPCNALISDVDSENNALGYSGTNAGGNLVLQNSTWEHNGAGILPNTLDSEEHPPEYGTTIINNTVMYNGNEHAPSFALEHAAIGAGIGLPGGDYDYVAHNMVAHNSAYGILVIANLDKQFWLASGNVVEDNTVSDSGIADLVLATPSGANNCFRNNHVGSTLPVLLEQTHPCGSPLALNGGGDLGTTLRLLALTSGDFHSVDYKTVPAPPAEDPMPNADGPRGPMFTLSFPAGLQTTSGLPPAVGAAKAATLQPLGFSLYSIVQVLLALLDNLGFVVLYLVLAIAAVAEVARRKEFSPNARLGWIVALLLAPLALWAVTWLLGPLQGGWAALALLIVPLALPIVYFARVSKRGVRGHARLLVGAPVVAVALLLLLTILAGFIA